MHLHLHSNVASLQVKEFDDLQGNLHNLALVWGVSHMSKRDVRVAMFISSHLSSSVQYSWSSHDLLLLRYKNTAPSGLVVLGRGFAQVVRVGTGCVRSAEAVNRQATGSHRALFSTHIGVHAFPAAATAAAEVVAVRAVSRSPR